MSKFDDENIGGKEYEAIRWSFSGDEEKARQLTGLGRKILGEMKNRMRLGRINFMTDTVSLEDGAIIKVSSNTIGLSDINAVDIFVPTSLGGGKTRCIGYIVQAFITDPADTSGSNYAQFEVTLPSQEVFKHDGAVNDSQLTNFLGFPDNGAKYLTMYSESPPYEATNCQQVVVKNTVASIVWDKKGPITYTWPDPTGSAPPIASGWSLVTEHQELSGSCGLDDLGNPILWSEVPSNHHTTVTQNGDYFEVTVLIPPSEAEDVLTYPSSTIYTSGIYTGDHDKFPIGGGAYICIRHENPTGPWEGTGYDSGSWYNAVTAYDNTTNNPIRDAALAEASQYCYDLWEPIFFDSTSTTYSSSLLDDTPNLNAMIRHKDGKGFITYSGMYFSDGRIILDKRKADHGRSALFMIPLGDRKIFSHSNALQTENEQSLTSTSSFYRGEIDTIEEYRTDGFLGPSYFIRGSTDDPPNFVQNFSNVKSVQDEFGVPIVVEEGIHKIVIKRKTAAGTMRLKVYLMLENFGFGTLDINTVTFSGLTSNKDLYITVGPLDDVNKFASLVGFS